MPHRTNKATQPTQRNAHERSERLRGEIPGAQPDVAEEEEEVAVVGVADGVEHPWAVVVHVEHELVRDAVEV